MGIVAYIPYYGHYLKDPKLWELWYLFLLMGNAGFISSAVRNTPKRLKAPLAAFEATPATAETLAASRGWPRTRQAAETVPKQNPKP